MLRYAAPAVATLALLLAAPPAMALDQVRFYAPFEDTVDPQFAAGRAGPIARGQEAFTSGRRGRALSVTSASAPLEYLATGNLQGSSGTLAFWVRLDWTPSSSDPDREYRHLFNMNRFGFMAYLHMGRLVVASGTSDAAGKWTWHYGPSERVDGWRAGEWHHVAITWSSDDRACDKAVYVDGSLAAQRTGGPVHRMVSEATFRVAPVNDGLLASGAYDDLVITGRPLSAAEVAALARGDHDAALDALKIASPEPPALAVERATIDARDHLYFEDDMIRVETTLTGNLDGRNDYEVRLALVDFWGQETQASSERVNLAKGEAVRRTYTFRAALKGIFKPVLRYEAAGKQGSRDLVTFGVVSRGPAESGPKPDSPFGIHVWAQDRYTDLAKKLGAKWVRGLDTMQFTWWSRVQPQRGQWVWHDDQAKLVRDQGFNMMGVLFFTPEWASTGTATADKSFAASLRNTGRHPPRDLQEFGEYVYRTVEHYKDTIREWEVWNEPHSAHAWSGTPEQYADLQRVAYENAKRADPTCKVYGMGGVSLYYVDEVVEPVLARLKSTPGAFPAMDAMSFHGYYRTESLVEADEFPQRIAAARAILDRHGARVPLILSESGVSSSTFYDDLDLPELPPISVRSPRDHQTGASELVRVFASVLKEDVRRWFLYTALPSPRHRAYQDYILLEHDGAPKSPCLSYAALTSVLEGARFHREHGLHPQVSAIQFDRGAEQVVILWTSGAAQLELEVPWAWNQATRVDLMGNGHLPTQSGGGLKLDLSSEVQYLVLRADAATAAQALGSARVIDPNPPALPVATPVIQSVVRSHRATVTLSCATPGADLRFSLDGSEPTAGSPLYRGPLTLVRTTIVKARGFKAGRPESAVASHEVRIQRKKRPWWAFWR